jgi:hippurate hydrolase
VLSVTIIKAGEANNVVPDSAFISGTVRTFDDQVTELIETGMRRIAQLTAEAHGASADVMFARYYPPTINHPEQSEFAASVAEEMVGAQNTLRDIEPAMTAEDFSFMLRACPGAYLWFGNGDGSHRTAGHGLGPCTLHNASYDFNDELLSVGATYWVRLAETFLASTP